METNQINDMLAEFCGLIRTGPNGWKYNYPCDDVPEGRFYCRYEDWKPDQNWEHLMLVITIIGINDYLDDTENANTVKDAIPDMAITFTRIVNFVKEYNKR